MVTQLVAGEDYSPLLRVLRLDDEDNPVVPVSVEAVLVPTDPPLDLDPTIDPVTGYVDLFVKGEDTRAWVKTVQPSDGLVLEVWFSDDAGESHRVLTEEVTVVWPARS